MLMSRRRQHSGLVPLFFLSIIISVIISINAIVSSSRINFKTDRQNINPFWGPAWEAEMCFSTHSVLLFLIRESTIVHDLYFQSDYCNYYYHFLKQHHHILAV